MEPCFDSHMRCSLQHNLCICKEGYKLSEDGHSCILITASISEIPCDRDAHCRRLPNSQCNEEKGWWNFIVLLSLAYLALNAVFSTTLAQTASVTSVTLRTLHFKSVLF